MNSCDTRYYVLMDGPASLGGERCNLVTDCPDPGVVERPRVSDVVSL
jgi:hypothetical protein